MVFREMRHSLELFAEKFIKTTKHASLFEKLQVLAKSMIFEEMRHFLQGFAEKLIKTQKHASLLEKLQVFAKWIIFHGFSRNEALFSTFC